MTFHRADKRIPRSLACLCREFSTALGFPAEFGRVVQFELQAFWVRWVYRFSPWQIRARRSLRGKKDLRLHFGCGERILDGWVNVDGIPNPRADLLWDLRGPLPLFSQSVQYIFSEHLIEHLRWGEACRFLRECWRVLQPGGAIRLVSPDLEKFVRAYVAQDQGFFRRASPESPEPGGALNLVFRRDGHHHYLFDYAELERALRHAGFVHVHRSAYGESSRPELNLDSPDEQRRTESLYVEAFK